MPPSHPFPRTPGGFELETELGKRLLEFDPDVIRGRDVRILVDGKRAAAVPFPKPAKPYEEVAFELNGHPLVGATWLPPEGSAAGVPLRYDLFADGRSLTDGSSLTDVRAAASTAQAPYPGSFGVLDAVVRIGPSAGSAGLVVGLGRRVAEIGWPRAIPLLAVLLVGVGSAAALGSRSWELIRADESRSVRRRAILGWMAILACYTVALVVILVFAATLTR